MNRFRKRPPSLFKFIQRIIFIVLGFSLLLLLIADDASYLYLFSHSNNSSGSNLHAGTNSSQDDSSMSTYEMDGLNFALVAQMNESYYKELLQLYIQASAGELDGFSYHPTADSFLSLQIFETGYYEGTKIPLSYLPIVDNKVIWNEEYKGIAAEKMTLVKFGTEEWKQLTPSDLCERMNEQVLPNGNSIRTPWRISGAIKNVSKISPTGQEDFRYIPNDLVYLTDVYNQVLSKLGLNKSNIVLGDAAKRYLFASSYAFGADGTLQSLFGVSNSTPRYLDTSKLKKDDVLSGISAFTNLVASYIGDHSKDTEWYKLSSSKDMQNVAIILASKTDGWFISEDVCNSITQETVEVWNKLFPGDGIKDLATCKELLKQKTSTLTNAVQKITGKQITQDDIEQIYGLYDSEDALGIYYISQNTSDVYFNKYSDGSNPNIVTTIPLDTSALFINSLMYTNVYYTEMLKLGGLTSVDVTNPYKEKLITNSINNTTTDTSLLNQCFSQCEIDNSLLSSKRIELLNKAASLLGKTHYTWGGGHDHVYSAGEDAHACATTAGLYDLDCSGYASWVYNSCGISDINGATPQMLQQGTAIGWADIKPEDLVVCDSHVMIFVSIDSSNNSWFIDVGGGGEGWTCASNSGPNACNLHTVSIPVYTTGSGYDTVTTSGSGSDGRTYRVIRSNLLMADDSTSTFIPSGS